MRYAVGEGQMAEKSLIQRQVTLVQVHPALEARLCSFLVRAVGGWRISEGTLQCFGHHSRAWPSHAASNYPKLSLRG